jgi:exodeoxyribonuclease V beta subunit
MNETPASVENFDLGRHAVVEASAGTGKTYTIEQLVLRLLTEETVPLEQILVVTFTEKATGELRTRLRGMLQREIQKNGDFTSLLKSALNHFDQAPIFTIHGFCQRLLQEYALEQGQDFRAELVDDIDLLKTSLREIQLKHWRTYFGDRLKAVLEKALYNRDTAGDWDRRVLEIAGKYKPRCGHQLRPACTPDWWKRLDEPDANWAGQLEIFTINTLHQQLRDFKRQRGLQSFDDMIATVEESLDPAKNPDAKSFLQTLRLRYRHGIVDEFQDTDPLQWRIFRRIFLEGGESKLFVVGDPKQAIFGFRGADLPTYLHATEEMRTHFNASEYPLQVNWRSDPDLLEGLNCLFEDGDWFPRAAGIRYVHVHAPDDDKRQTRLEDDRTNRAAMTIVDTSQWDRLKAAQKQYARFAAQEIQSLLAGGADRPMLSFARKNSPPRPLNAGDICVLVMKRADAEPIMQALDLVGIAYSFYKQTGLWKSDEAIHLEVLLQTLARPEDRSSFRKALLTCFFRVKPEDLVRAPDVPTQHPARQLYQAWLGYAENRQWSALCRSLLEDTGLLFPAQGDADADRRLSNLRHLLTTIEQIGYGLNLDLLGLLDWIEHRRQQRDGADADLQPVDMDAPKVKIMTIHASKGLEFPVVILAGGFTQAPISGGQTVYRDDQGSVVFDLDRENDAQQRVLDERLSEQRRLLYVALTRPIFKLYLPKIKKPTRGNQFLGPLGTILLPALEQACPDKLGPLIAEIVTPTLTPSAPKPNAEPMANTPSAMVPFHLVGPLFPIIDSNLGKRRIATRSFSSMTKHHLAQIGEGSSFGEQAPIAGDEAPTPLDREDPLRGPVFGDMVHNVLERIDFAEVGRAGVPDDLFKVGTHARQLLDREIKANIALLRTRTPIDQLEQACRQQIASLVWHALHTPLAEIGGTLGGIPARDRLHEIEFLYPERDEARMEERFITGFMDLLLRAHNKYYLVDWKTNLLPGYSQSQLERSMTESDYHRQYRLYLQAVKRWLVRAHGPKFSFAEQFGGVYYLYVRGLNARDESAGVYFHRPTEQDLDLDFVLKY